MIDLHGIGNRLRRRQQGMSYVFRVYLRRTFDDLRKRIAGVLVGVGRQGAKRLDLSKLIANPKRVQSLRAGSLSGRRGDGSAGGPTFLAFLGRTKRDFFGHHPKKLRGRRRIGR